MKLNIYCPFCNTINKHEYNGKTDVQENYWINCCNDKCLGRFNIVVDNWLSEKKMMRHFLIGFYKRWETDDETP